MTIVCNIWMICLELNWLFYDQSWMVQLVVFNNFLLIDATDRSKISSDQKRLFFAVSLYPLSFFANTPFNKCLVLAPNLHCYWSWNAQVNLQKKNTIEEKIMDENLLEVASTVPFSSKLHLNIFRVEKLELKNIRLKKFEEILHQPSIQWTR